MQTYPGTTSSGSQSSDMKNGTNRIPLAPGRQDRLGLELQEVTNAMVHIYKELFGRGPTKAHTVYATKDLLVCTLENSLTPAEEKMLAFDEHQRVREIRMFFQHAAEKEFVETVERISGRRVRGFVSGMDTHQDISTEVFYLEPQAASANDG